MLSLGRLLPRPIAQHPTVSPARVLDASNDDQTDTSSSFPSRYALYRSESSLICYCSYPLLGRPVGPARSRTVDSRFGRVAPPPSLSPGPSRPSTSPVDPTRRR